jgi:His-Xaa-Ser system protein HxsD
MQENFEFERAAYSVSAIQKAAYRGSRFFTIDLKLTDDIILCGLKKTSDCSDEEYSQAMEVFKKDALDYVLREKISAETEAMRNMILGLAFSKSGLIDE